MSKGKTDFDMPAQSDGDVYVNHGQDFTQGEYYPEAPEAQREAESKEKAVKASSYPVLKELAEWFEAQVKECDSVGNIQVDTMTINGITYDRKTSIEAQVLAYQLLKQKLEDKYVEFQQFQEKDDE